MQVGSSRSSDGRHGTRERTVMRKRGNRAVLALLAGVLSAGCEESVDLIMPTATEVESFFEYGGGLQAEVRGNVAVITVVQSSTQLRRGGTLWAKVGPYVFLFTEETNALLETRGHLRIRVVEVRAPDDRGPPQLARPQSGPSRTIVKSQFKV